MNKEKVKLANDLALGKIEGSKEIIDKFRAELGIKGGNMNPVCDEYGLERVRCDEAEFFPNPPSFWNQSSPLLYRLLADNADDYIRAWEYKGIRVVVSAVKYNNWEWLHVTFSRQNRIPSYDEVQLVRNTFIGEDKKSIMVFPSKEHYVNNAKYCLHLWYSKDNPIPDFDINIPMLGRSI